MGSGEQEELHCTFNFMSIDNFWDLCEERKHYLTYLQEIIEHF
jgi:hypothetical protein